MTGFDTFAMVDWSGGNDQGPRPKADAIWIAVARNGRVEPAQYFRNRTLAEAWLADLIADETAAQRRLCIGFDFPFGYPAGFAEAVTGSPDPLDLWDWIAARIEDAPDRNNRFDLAAELNLALGDGAGPFWGNALKRDIVGLPRRKDSYRNPFAERRKAEHIAKGAFTCWQLAGAGAVGSQVLMGLPVLSRLRARFADAVAVWPFQPLDRPVAFVEIWPSLIADAVRLELDVRAGDAVIKDAVQVELVARALSRCPAAELADWLDVEAPEEGWILGLGHEAHFAALAGQSDLKPPPLSNDCFALPAGVDWTPVEDALAHLRNRLTPITGAETVPLMQGLGRILASDHIAQRSNPPHANAAVDGYGFAGPMPEGDHILPLLAHRATAGPKLKDPVPPGQAVRILTGAALPDGVDTVVLQEDVTVGDGIIAFRGPIKKGANARAAGEDMQAGQVVLEKGRRVTAPDLALAAATGLSDFTVHAPLKVAVLSTGDELVAPGTPAAPGQIHDANRPMLLALIDEMGFEAVDLGHVPDDRTALRDRIDLAASQADVLLTSGGASAGDEDHVSALLNEAGAMQQWRIAMKPGRPLALGLWKGMPIFGLPGNPVAAFVCTLIFAAPAMRMLAGMAWSVPQGFTMPAAFTKRKKPGRREYLRARIRDGQVETFASEGSGRISGLSWSTGLVQLDEAALTIEPGDPVQFVPYHFYLSPQ